ncbi:thioredoxin-disulfide reductase [Patescibacteria group bacterium]|nr:thioredoxin-disulfide reductase [Patescibacteria group bacterium]
MKKIIIIGSGPAGLTAAIYGARDSFEILVIEGSQPGGQLTTTTIVENYPGFEEGVNGVELIQKMKKQAQKYGASFISESVKSVNFSQKPFKIVTNSSEYSADVVIIATGARSRSLELPNEKAFWGKGIHTCATCDGYFYKDKKVIVVGGGDSAMEEAGFLAKFAEKVMLIHRKNIFTASKILQERILNNPKIEAFWDTEIKEYLGKDRINAVKLINNKNNQESKMLIDGIFMAIGHIPNTEFLKNQLKLGKNNYIEPINNVYTEIKGVFVAGDVADWRYRQAITAAGFGCMAVLAAEKYLDER